MTDEPAVGADRFLEIGLEWFDPDRIDEQVALLHERFAPLWTATQGRCGVVINVGWVVDVVTEWTGDPDQRLPLQGRRRTIWAQRSYADLRALVARLRAGAPHDRFHVGLFAVGWGEVVFPPDETMYDVRSSWYERHPELYPLSVTTVAGAPMPDLDPRVGLQADAYPYAAFPDGLPAGISYGQALGAQWREVSTFLDMDVLHLRDGFLGPMVYARSGPAGSLGPTDPGEAQSWTDAVARLFVELKQARPDALIMAYSSAISPVAELRVGCVDLEEVIARGGIDIFIDQSWGGAWQDWWDNQRSGWTHQLAYILTHAAMIAAGNRRRPAWLAPCTHHVLIETWDAEELWDTLHRVPGKLRWAIWAYTHAATHTAGAVTPTGGVYVSWANSYFGGLLGDDEVAFLARELDAAQADAAGLESVHGPVLVLDREQLDRVAVEQPGENLAEWVDDHAGFLLKFGVPLLASAERRQLPDTGIDGGVFGLPATALPPELPAVVTGRADQLGDDVHTAAGIVAVGQVQAQGWYEAGPPSAPRLADAMHLPAHAEVVVADDVTVHYTARTAPLLTSRGAVTWWQPPDWSSPAELAMPPFSLGSLEPHVTAAAQLNRAVRAAGGNAAEAVAIHQPVTWHVWRSRGRVQLLFGNLETGWVGDARTPRVITIHLDAASLGLDPACVHRLVPVSDLDGPPIDGVDLRFEVAVPPEGCRVLRVEPVR
ncbi:MAG: hypothetical protein JJT89_02765 [Nitriliruptoraceae bacterium]|nr:hypothetical protein [Nitriliruptoraceae bacterium]